MKGTNHGSKMGLPPTGKPLAVPGADFFRMKVGLIQSVTGYFDSRAVPTQLGLDVIVQPNQIGPFKFGISSMVQTARRRSPGPSPSPISRRLPGCGAEGAARARATR